MHITSVIPIITQNTNLALRDIFFFQFAESATVHTLPITVKIVQQLAVNKNFTFWNAAIKRRNTKVSIFVREMGVNITGIALEQY